MRAGQEQENQLRFSTREVPYILHLPYRLVHVDVSLGYVGIGAPNYHFSNRLGIFSYANKEKRIANMVRFGLQKEIRSSFTSVNQTI